MYELPTVANRLEVRLDTSLERLLARAPHEHVSGVLATIVATAGSTYRKPGARMLLMADGSYLGLLSGGCLESDLQVHAREVLGSGVPRAVEYDMRGPDDVLFGLGAGCEGVMRVLLEPAGPGTPAAATLAAAGRATQAGAPVSLVLVHDSLATRLGSYLADPTLPPALVAAADQALADRSSRAFDSGSGPTRTRAYIQFLAPPPHLLICGAGPDAQPVVRIARELGWRISIVDHRPAFALPARFPGANVRLANPKSLGSEIDLAHCHAAVVMSHHLNSDQSYLRELAQAGAPGYIGLLGPSARRARLMDGLSSVAEKLHSRLRGPAGLDIGAATPEGIALSIVAQIHAWLAGRPGAQALG
jgi:xanthine dehydrogenase accessory factor